MTEIRKTIALLMVLTFVNHARADENDPDDVVRCKHCRQSMEICSYLKTCCRYTENRSDSVLYNPSPSERVSAPVLPCNYEIPPVRLSSGGSFRFIGGFQSGEPVFFQPYHENLFSVGQLEYRHHLIDFLSIFSSKTAEDDKNDINPGSEMGNLSPGNRGDIMLPDQSPVGTTVVELDAPEDVFPEASRAIQNPEVTVRYKENPLFIFFKQEMNVLKYEFADKAINHLLKQLNIPRGTTIEDVNSMISSVLESVNARFVPQNQVYHPVSSGTHLLLVQNIEANEWFSAIVVLTGHYVFLFLLNAQNSLKTLVSTDTIFTKNLQELAGKPQASACLNAAEVCFNLCLYPLIFSVAPLVAPQRLTAGISEYQMIVIDEDSEDTSSESSLDEFDNIELMTVSWSVEDIPVMTQSHVQSQPAGVVSHIQAVYTNLTRVCREQTERTVSFTPGISASTLITVIEIMSEQDFFISDTMVALFATFGINLIQLTGQPNPQLPNGSFMLLIHSEPRQELPAVLFVSHAEPDLTVWFVNPFLGDVFLDRIRTTSKLFRKFLDNFQLFQVCVFLLQG